MVDKQLETLAYRLKDLSSLRNLFSELNFDFADKPVNKDNWNDDQKRIVQEAKIIASKDDYQIYYIQTNTDSLKEWKGISSKIIKDNHGLCMICSHNPSGFKWVFSSLSKEFSKSFSETRHVPIDIKPDIGVPKTFVDFLEKIKVGKDSTGTSIVSQVSEAFDSFAVQIHDELTVNVFEALKILSEGIIGDKNNNFSLSNETLEKIREPIFILLYRIIFILYAEDRGIFPVDNKIYQEEFSLKWVKQNWLLEPANTKKLTEFEVGTRIKRLFRLIEIGSEDLDYDKDEFFMRSYYGRIFDRKINHRLEEWSVPNANFLEMLSLLTRTKDKKGNYFFLDYSALEIRHLGSIYEHLLEYHLTVKDKKITELPNTKDRKTSGSYYTPKYIVDYIVKNSIEPLIANIIEKNPDKQIQIEKILSLKILDPAMGSGHFLVGAVEYVATRLCEIESNEIDEQKFIERKRDVARQCIYGVDINPLAVNLTRLSLWLETLSSEKPLSFLSAHIKTGNSLIGTEINSIFEKQTTLFESEIGRNVFKKNIKKFLMFENLEDDSSSAVKMKIEEYMRIQSKGTIYDDLKFLLDAQISKIFGVDIPNLGDFRAKIGKQSLDFHLDKEYKKTYETVRKLSTHEQFFHWELEFPQIFFEENGMKKSNGGFDIIIGNPPYVRNRDLKTTHKKFFAKKFGVANGQYDLYQLFFEKSDELLKENNPLSFITPNKYTITSYAKNLREYILNNFKIVTINDVSNLEVFKSVSTYPYITFLEKEKKKTNRTSNRIEILESNTKFNDSLVIRRIPQKDFDFNIHLDVAQQNILNLINEDSTLLKNFIIKETVHTGNIRDKLISSTNADQKYKKLLRGKDCQKYFFTWNNLWLNNEYKIKKDKNEYATIPDKKFFNTPKIFLREIAETITACYDDENYYSLNKAYVIIIDDPKFSTKYVLGILNSKLMSWYFRKKFSSAHVRGGYLQFKKQYTEQIPIKILTKKQQNSIIHLVDLLHLEINSKNNSDKIENLKNQIDDLVFKLYKIPEKEKMTIMEECS